MNLNPFALFQESEREKAVKKRVQTATIKHKKACQENEEARHDLAVCLQSASASRADLPKVEAEPPR